MGADDYMRPNDVTAFREAAKRFRVWIIVRASNPAAKRYIGVNGYLPKRLDCKAKTADHDVTLPGASGKKKTAGLVVNPTIEGMQSAFEELERARGAWNEFQNRCYIPKAGVPPLPYFPDGKLYSVQMNPSHPHYGCVTFSSWSNTANACYIHSDYDLYGIVREDDPAGNVRVEETRLDEPHTRSRQFFDVQHYLNKRMGVPMILHGEQETFKDDVDDDLDVFCPDGITILEANGAHAIRKLYHVTFQGRPLYGKNSSPKPFFGMWQRL